MNFRTLLELQVTFSNSQIVQLNDSELKIQRNSFSRIGTIVYGITFHKRYVH